MNPLERMLRENEAAMALAGAIGTQIPFSDRKVDTQDSEIEIKPYLKEIYTINDKSSKKLIRTIIDTGLGLAAFEEPSHPVSWDGISAAERFDGHIGYEPGILAKLGMFAGDQVADWGTPLLSITELEALIAEKEVLDQHPDVTPLFEEKGPFGSYNPEIISEEKRINLELPKEDFSTSKLGEIEYSKVVDEFMKQPGGALQIAIFNYVNTLRLDPFIYINTQDGIVTRAARRLLTNPSFVESEARAVVESDPSIMEFYQAARTRYTATVVPVLSGFTSSLANDLGLYSLLEEAPETKTPDALAAVTEQIDKVNFCEKQVRGILETEQLKDAYATPVAAKAESLAR